MNVKLAFMCLEGACDGIELLIYAFLGFVFAVFIVVLGITYYLWQMSVEKRSRTLIGWKIWFSILVLIGLYIAFMVIRVFI